MFFRFLAVYFYTIFSLAVAILISAYCNINIRPIQELFIFVLGRFTSFLPVNRKVKEENNNRRSSLLQKRHLTPENVLADKSTNVVEMSLYLLTSGMECIVQDDIERPFEWAPVEEWTLLSWPPSWVPLQERLLLIVIYLIGWAFRWLFLFPVRILVLIHGTVHLATTSIFAYTTKCSKKWTVYFSVVFGRIFCALTGLVVRTSGEEFKPQLSGIAVSNHLTSNDIQTMLSLCDDIGYTLTGQVHRGFIMHLQKFGDNLMPTLWMDRANPSQRTSLKDNVISYASAPGVFPVLLFPEGFCTNNQVVMQFRKAVFTGQVPIYPISIKQDARFGDQFWKEDTYLWHLLRLMTSFVAIYEVTFLPKMEKYENERDSDFARRVQRKIASSAGIEALPYDASLKRPKDRLAYKLKIQESLWINIQSMI